MARYVNTTKEQERLNSSQEGYWEYSKSNSLSDVGMKSGKNIFLKPKIIFFSGYLDIAYCSCSYPIRHAMHNGLIRDQGWLLVAKWRLLSKVSGVLYRTCTENMQRFTEKSPRQDTIDYQL